MWRRGAVLLTIAVAPVSGCAHGPDLADSAAQLRVDARAVLVVGAAQLGGPGARPQVVYATVQPCPGGAQYRYRASLPLRPGPDSTVVLDRAADLSLDLIAARGYHLTAPPRHHAFTATHPSPAVSMTVRLHGGRHPTLVLDAGTPCL